jgi:dipeptidyl aminopeptidase/acylaminoacyl peptidase
VQAQCTASIPPQHPLAIVVIASQRQLVDVADPQRPAPLCTIATNLSTLRFVSRTQIAYAIGQADGSGSIATLDLASNQEVTIAGWPAGRFGDGTFAFSPDGQRLAYLSSSSTGVELHLVAEENDRTLATLPPIPGRGVSPDNDDMMLTFSPDGTLLALVETFTGSGTGDAAPFQVRRADGSLLAAGPVGRTMGVWSGDLLFFRDGSGVERWAAPNAVGSLLPGVTWIRPQASPDGRWLAYTLRDSTGLPHVYVYDLQQHSAHQLWPGGAANPVFVTSGVIWFAGERLCQASDNCEMGPPSAPTGQTYLLNLQTSQVTPSTIGAVIDVLPAGR